MFFSHSARTLSKDFLDQRKAWAWLFHSRTKASRRSASFFLVSEIDDAQSFPLEDAEPLFDLIHPGAMDGRMMELEAGMVGQPGFDLLALVHPQVVEHDVNRGYGRVDFVV